MAKVVYKYTEKRLSICPQFSLYSMPANMHSALIMSYIAVARTRLHFANIFQLCDYPKCNKNTHK